MANGRRNIFRNVQANQTLTLRPCFPAGDADGDAVVNFGDLNEVLDGWGQSVVPWRTGDANGDGVVDVADLEDVLDNWLNTCEG